ncbi:hypothetical protein HMPREF9440_00670 [Sutterella parvirubra YIT 11816]|uniref:Uncharacterized protein n=1 Tax=Sutterella parvirubra YIT 11816 TaxID=762967 RepID=H3KD64_9BURK|nr:hypothetical protein HMPREF9440_00670 [Sutterella parvirubra YIT 11816]
MSVGVSIFTREETTTVKNLTKIIVSAGLAAGLAAAALTASAAETWSRRPTLEVKANPGSDYLGTLDIASPVTVLEKKNGMAKVRIDGWSLKEYPSQIFQEAGLRIEYASFDEEKAVKLNAKGGEKTVQGNVWQKSSAEGWVPEASLTKDLDALWKAGAARHADACSSCHGAPKPEHFTANQWSSQLPVRGGRTGHTRRGNNALMFKWLQAHAKPM